MNNNIKSNNVIDYGNKMKKKLIKQLRGRGDCFNSYNNCDRRHLYESFLSYPVSVDGTIKNTVRLNDNNLVEAVLIPTLNRKTACVSSQVGCSLNCEFCATSKIKNIRNLKKEEIFDQVFLMNKQSLNYYNKPLTNIVFMGMGEPLMNYRNVISAIGKITDPSFLGFSPNRITISTSGIPKFIKKLADDNIKVGLAISLHSAREKIREKIMPFTKKIYIKTFK